MRPPPRSSIKTGMPCSISILKKTPPRSLQAPHRHGRATTHCFRLQLRFPRHPKSRAFQFFHGLFRRPTRRVLRRRSSPRPLPAKDTLTNILATKEFVVNIVSEEFADKMNVTSAEVAPDVDEFSLSGLTPLASELVQPPAARRRKSRAYGVSLT